MEHDAEGAPSRRSIPSAFLSSVANYVPLHLLPATGLLRLKTAYLGIGLIGVLVLIANAVGWMPLAGDAGRRGRQYPSDVPMSGSASALAPESISPTREITMAAAIESPRPTATPTPRTHEVRSGESLLEIAAQYDVSVDAISEVSGLWDPNRLRVGQVLTIPVPGYVAHTPAPDKSSDLRLWWPMQGEITTYFGEKEAYYLSGAHTGIDLAADVGAPVRAAADGKVVVAVKQANNLGWHIVLDHGSGYSTVYGHLSRFAVDEGDVVKRGGAIGSVGNTGFSLGPHLHFEVRRSGTPVDPLKYLP